MGEGEPKYLNGAESPLFKKKSNLFNLDRARPHMRKKDRALVVEGYFDVIACAVHGFEEDRGPSGHRTNRPAGAPAQRPGQPGGAFV